MGRSTNGPTRSNYVHSSGSSSCDNSHLAYQCILNEPLVSQTNDKLILTKQSATAPRQTGNINKCRRQGLVSDLPGMLLNWNLMCLELFTNTSHQGDATWGIGRRTQDVGRRADIGSLDKAKWRQLWATLQNVRPERGERKMRFKVTLDVGNVTA